MRAWLLALLLPLVGSAALADEAASTELTLVSEHAVDGMRGGNLSGLALCGGSLWTVSDRDDDQYYRLDTQAPVWQAQPRHVVVPAAPDTGLPFGIKVRNWAASYLRGGSLDFEGITCDSAGNHYLVSEAHAAVLKVPAVGEVHWLKIAPGMVRQARASAMLLHFNALFEGIAINPAGDKLWLAAERERRGLLLVQRQQTVWDCGQGCVLLSEGGQQRQPEAAGGRMVSKDFADLTWYDGKLYTLERNAYSICRRDSQTAAVERCWSFASEMLQPQRRYNQPYGLAEALALDKDGAWIGLDNNNGARADGERRPVVYRFAAPAGGWGGKP